MAVATDLVGMDMGWMEPRWVNPASINSTQAIMQMQQQALTVPYENKTVEECFAMYEDSSAPVGNVIILIQNQTAQSPEAFSNSSLLLYVTIKPRYDDWAKNLWALDNGTQHSFTVIEPTDNVTVWLLGPPQFLASYCLVQPPVADSQVCRFEYCSWIMYAVCTLNFVKMLTITCVWLLSCWRRRQAAGTEESLSPELCTLGDAIASFMRDPDPHTKDMGLATKYDFPTKKKEGTWWWQAGRKSPRVTTSEALSKSHTFLTNGLSKTSEIADSTSWPRRYKKQKRIWLVAATRGRLIGLFFACFFILTFGLVLLSASLPALVRRKIDTTISGLWAMGFGKIVEYNYMVWGLPAPDPWGLLLNVLLANTPQLALSVLYLYYNGVVTMFMVQREFGQMHAASKRRTLRVSEPVGIQRSSYMISLPLRYGLPMSAMSVVMHWLISESVFLARVSALTPEGIYDAMNSFSTCAYSPMPILASKYFFSIPYIPFSFSHHYTLTSLFFNRISHYYQSR
jgi:hypothetical protein